MMRPNAAEEFEAEMNGAVFMGEDFNRIFLNQDKMDRDGTRDGLTSSFHYYARNGSLGLR